MVDQVPAESQEVALPLRYDVPASLETRYATNFTVQHTDQEFVLGFYEVRLPVLVGSPEENLAAVREMSAVTAQCVARLVVTPARMAELIQVLTANYEHYRARQSEGEA